MSDLTWTDAADRDRDALLCQEDAWDRHLEDEAEERAAARWARRLARLRPLSRLARRSTSCDGSGVALPN